MTYEEVIKNLKKESNPRNVAGMARFGINPKKTLGVSVPFLRKLAKETRKSHSAKAPRDLHQLAQKLWQSNIHEAQILASMIDVPNLVTDAQMDKWASEFDSWDVCDQVCMNLFDKTPYAFNKAKKWTEKMGEFHKRAGFALMACLAWHDKTSPNSKFEKFFPFIKKESIDERNFVKKAVNWALRQIGKRNKNLKKKAIEVAKEIQSIDSKSAKWIVKDALKELAEKKVN